MKLERVHIRNFRSIQDAELDFSSKCRVLVGINESGKSNVLKAISSLGSFVPSAADDIREPSPNEDPISESFVRFSFSLDKVELEAVFEEVSKSIFARNLNTAIIATNHRKKLTLKSFVQLRGQGLYEVDLIANKKHPLYWAIGSNFELLPGWSRPSKACPKDHLLTAKDGTMVLLKTLRLVRTADCAGISDWLEPAELKDLTEPVGSAVTTQIKLRIPQVLFWEYSENNLLPGAVSLEEFASDPDTCLPLKNMFSLAEIDDIPKALNAARSGSRNTLHNFFAKVAEKTTAHFRNVWREHRSIEFELVPDGDNLIPGIREKNRFDFAKRSDGFKRFVSFLLLISAKVKSGELSDTVLLIDEPDISLHPSGARFLRDELIEISKTNHVVYSTHSIFMIDRENIERHIIVTKQNEKTKLSEANESNVVDEEVLFNAIGYSIFESLRKKNLVFEGWSDKHLFQTAMKRVPSNYSSLKKAFAEVGICHAKGVKDIKNITPMMELANRSCLIISDSDAAAREKQREFIENQGYGIWKRYDELLEQSESIVTSEDFLKAAAFEPILKEVEGRLGIPGFNQTSLNDPRGGRLHVISEWLRSGNLSKEAREKEIRYIKKSLSKDLSAGDIDDVYFVYLVALSKCLKALQ
jgi:energy-coupling factor transporter ATP-binding protein EcfA2